MLRAALDNVYNIKVHGLIVDGTDDELMAYLLFADWQNESPFVRIVNRGGGDITSQFRD